MVSPSRGASSRMTELRVVLVDDEPLVRRGMRALLRAADDVRVVGEARNGKEAVTVIRQTRPDLVFLDVQMPEQDGFAVLDQLEPDRLPAIVFVTAHDEHAVRAFEHHAVDYVLKPFDEKRFHVALTRARSRLRERSDPADPRLERVRAELRSASRHLERLLVKHDSRLTVVEADDIDWLEAADNYVRVHTTRTRYLVRTSIKVIEQQLDPNRFARIHRSTIVNLARVGELHPLFGGEYEVRLTTGARLRLSRSYRTAFLTVFGELG